LSRPRRRHSTGFGYIGFGNNQDLFNRKASKPFSGVKNKLNKESHKAFNTHYSHHTLTDAERNQIKDSIRKKSKRKNILAAVITAFLMLALISFVLYKLNFNF
jgi:hypothetical protein